MEDAAANPTASPKEAISAALAAAAIRLRAECAEQIRAAIGKTITELTGPDLVKANAALEDLAGLTVEAIAHPDRAAALKAESAFPIATLAALAAKHESEIVAAWKSAAWNTLRAMAHTASDAIAAAAPIIAAAAL